jgi:hypothetical protein
VGPRGSDGIVPDFATPEVFPAKPVTERGLTCCTGEVPKHDDECLATLTPLRGITLGTSRPPDLTERVEEPALWFVTVTVGGDRVRANSVREGLERLSLEQPFLVSAGYASSRAEVRYWDESVDVEGAVSQAMRLWSDHEVSAGLPAWRVVGLEVVDRDTARRRWSTEPNLQVVGLGEIRPMDGPDN